MMGFLIAGNYANAQDLLTMEGIAAYAFTHGKTTCTGGNDVNGSGGMGNGQFDIISNCDGDNGTHMFTVMGPSPLGGVASVTFEGAIFVDSQIGLLDGSGGRTPATFPYQGVVNSDSYIMAKAKMKKEITAWCLLTPDPEFGSTAVIDIEMSYSFDRWFSHCEDKNGNVIEGTWNIPFGSINGTGGKGRDKNRGKWCIGFMAFDLTRGSTDTYEN
jgi:hypothetical protein